VIDDVLEAKRVAEAIWDFHQPFIDEVNLFDVYRGAPIPEGKKGVSYRIRYQSNDRTLKDEEVNRYHEKVILQLREIFRVELRQ
jgi:phenylalanyl-tRNA synthetase beta chain